jgi:nitric-oxide synthase
LLERLWEAAEVVPAVGGHVITFVVVKSEPFLLGTQIMPRSLQIDKGRYNRLPQIAAAIGLEPTKRAPLWIDRALAVINEAVLFSFDQAGYKMTDHHTVSAKFDHFCQTETLNGRTVNGDWAWLVPPMSGATTPTFFKSFDSTVVLPNFLYQQAAWVDGLASVEGV